MGWEKNNLEIGDRPLGKLNSTDVSSFSVAQEKTLSQQREEAERKLTEYRLSSIKKYYKDSTSLEKELNKIREKDAININ